MFKIWCESDGTIGRREAWMKAKDGTEATFATEEEAKKSLPESRTLINGTVLRYSIVECSGSDDFVAALFMLAGRVRR